MKVDEVNKLLGEKFNSWINSFNWNKWGEKIGTYLQKGIDLAKDFAMQADRSELAVMNGCAPEDGMKTRKTAEALIKNGTVTVTGQIGVAMGIHTGPGLIGIGILQR